MSYEIKLGDKVRDKITGWAGVATARCEYLNGCVQFCVQPALDKDGKHVDGRYIDVVQLEVTEAAVPLLKVAAVRLRPSIAGKMANLLARHTFAV